MNDKKECIFYIHFTSFLYKKTKDKYHNDILERILLDKSREVNKAVLVDRSM